MCVVKAAYRLTHRPAAPLELLLFLPRPLPPFDPLLLEKEIRYHQYHQPNQANGHDEQREEVESLTNVAACVCNKRDKIEIYEAPKREEALEDRRVLNDEDGREEVGHLLVLWCRE